MEFFFDDLNSFDTEALNYIAYHLSGERKGMIEFRTPHTPTIPVYFKFPPDGKLPDGQNLFEILKKAGFISFKATGRSTQAECLYMANPVCAQKKVVPYPKNKTLLIFVYGSARAQELEVEMTEEEARAVHRQAVLAANHLKAAKAAGADLVKSQKAHDQQQPQAKHEGDGWSAGLSPRDKPSQRAKIATRSEQPAGGIKLVGR